MKQTTNNQKMKAAFYFILALALVFTFSKPTFAACGKNGKWVEVSLSEATRIAANTRSVPVKFGPDDYVALSGLGKDVTGLEGSQPIYLRQGYFEDFGNGDIAINALGFSMEDLGWSRPQNRIQIDLGWYHEGGFGPNQYDVFGGVIRYGEAGKTLQELDVTTLFGGDCMDKDLVIQIDY